MSGNNNTSGGKKMSQSDASRIQSTQEKSGQFTGANSFAARAQAGAANNTNAAAQQNGQQGQKK